MAWRVSSSSRYEEIFKETVVTPTATAVAAATMTTMTTTTTTTRWWRWSRVIIVPLCRVWIWHVCQPNHRPSDSGAVAVTETLAQPFSMHFLFFFCLSFSLSPRARAHTHNDSPDALLPPLDVQFNIPVFRAFSIHNNIKYFIPMLLHIPRHRVSQLYDPFVFSNVKNVRPSVQIYH